MKDDNCRFLIFTSTGDRLALLIKVDKVEIQKISIRCVYPFSSRQEVSEVMYS